MLTGSLLKGVIAAASLTAVLAQGYVYQPEQCAVESQAFPEQLELSDKYDYRYLEHGMQVFMDYEVPCDGFITEFRLLSSQTVIWGLHLGLFRRAYTTYYRFVDELYLNGYSTGVQGATWVIAKPDRPVFAKKGDLIGIFYDDFDAEDFTGRASILSESHTGPFAARGDNNSSKPQINTMVFLKDAAGMIVNKTLLNEDEAVYTNRHPGLYVLLSSYPNAVGLNDRQLGNLEDGRGLNQDLTTRPNLNIGLQFRDLKCNLLPNMQMWDECGAKLSIRYYFDISEKKCHSFLGCEKESRRPQQSSPETSWSNNFATIQECMTICREANVLAPSGPRGQAVGPMPEQNNMDGRGVWWGGNVTPSNLNVPNRVQGKK